MLENKAKNNIEKIIETVVFFDLFKFPLTALEIKKYSAVDLNLVQLDEILQEELRKNRLETKNGFYFLVNRAEIVDTRKERYNYSLRKIKIAKLFANIFFLTPGVSSVCLVNSIGANNLRDGGDIDFLIITKSKRIWLSRFFCTGIAKLLNKRPNKKSKRDKICLSFYLSEDNLFLGGLKLAKNDPYFNFWEKSILVLNDRRNAFARFVSVNNLENYYNFRNQDLKKKKKITFIKNLTDRLEMLSKKLQIKIMPKELLLANESGLSSQGVVFSDTIIKLYLSDKRLEIKEKYERKIKEIL